MFSGGIERDQWHELGKCNISTYSFNSIKRRLNKDFISVVDFAGLQKIRKSIELVGL